jgi:transcription elongation factor Elf1
MPWFQMPFFTCPRCGKRWQQEEYYDLHAGGSVTCPHCETEFDVVSVDTTMEVEIEAGSEA